MMHAEVIVVVHSGQSSAKLPDRMDYQEFKMPVDNNHPRCLLYRVGSLRPAWT